MILNTMFKVIKMTSVLTGLSQSFLVFAQPILLERPELKALAAIESGNDNHKVGNKGERGIYQMKSVIWKEHKKIFSRSKRLQSELAYDHMVNCLVIPFQKQTKRKVTAIDIYLMWNLGYSGYESCAFEPSVANKRSRDAAMRYHNLVEAYTNKN